MISQSSSRRLTISPPMRWEILHHARFWTEKVLSSRGYLQRRDRRDRRCLSGIANAGRSRIPGLQFPVRRSPRAIGKSSWIAQDVPSLQAAMSVPREGDALKTTKAPTPQVHSLAHTSPQSAFPVWVRS